MARIHDLPELERPRERALRYGIESLSNHDILALLISSGCRDKSAMDIAYDLLSQSRGLNNLVNMPFVDLLSHKGIGKNKAIKIVAAFELAKRFQISQVENKIVEDSEEIYQRYKHVLSNSNQEHVYLIILNRKKQIIHEVNLYKGTEDSVNYSHLHIIEQIILHRGAYFYVVHNHPNGSLSPSEDDIFFTTELIRQCNKFKIVLLDHIIVSRNGYYSFSKQLPTSKTTEVHSMALSEK